MSCEQTGMINLVTLIAALCSSICSLFLVYASILRYVLFGEVKGISLLIVSVIVTIALIALHRGEHGEGKRKKLDELPT